MKTAVCAIAKLENRYIREWVDYYIKIGFDKIILYDNNDIDGEYLIDPIKEYVDLGQVELIDIRGKKGYQVEAYNECYQKYKDQFDWITFLDIDEFIWFEEVDNIKDFLNLPKFKNYNLITLQWCYYDDNDLVKVENNNYSVLNRFTRRNDIWIENKPHKQIINTSLKDICINSVHIITTAIIRAETTSLMHNSDEAFKQVKACDSNGIEYFSRKIHNVNEQTAYIKHFRYKTLEEYLTIKCARGYPMPYRDYGKALNFFDFFHNNKVTQAKLDYAYSWLEKQNFPEEQKKQFIKDLEFYKTLKVD